MRLDGYVICSALDGGVLSPREACSTLEEAVGNLIEWHTLTLGAGRYEERVCDHGIKLNYDPSEWRIVLYLNGVPNGEAWQVDCDGTAKPV